jgi:DNA-binding NarL/FixJ family response regulator
MADSLAPPPGPHAGAAPRRVQTFIVDDSPIVLDNLIATLEELAPVRVVGHAPDEGTALRELQRRAPGLDLVIVDFFLKSGSGLGVLRGSARFGGAAKRVVLTNYATPGLREKCRGLGADRVFDKSTDLDELIDYCTGLAEVAG